MKKILALILVLSLFGALVACTQVTRISIDNPSERKETPEAKTGCRSFLDKKLFCI